MRGRHQCDPISGCGTFYKQGLLSCPSCNAPDWAATLIPYNPLDWIYDLETYPNIFTAAFKHVATGTRLLFEISERRNDLRDLVVFLQALKSAGCRMVGYNNIGFDYPIIHFILENALYIGLDEIYGKAQALINTHWNDRFSNLVKPWEIHICQIDLLKVHHFDNEARTTSLKMLECNMQSDDVEDLPFEPGVPIPVEDFPNLIKYNHHDDDETEKFYFETLEMLAFREQLGTKHDRNFLNHSDKKIGTELFVMALESANPGCCYIKVDGRRTPRQSIRTSIALADVIFPYIKFKRRGFALILEWMKQQTITKTKGVFEYLDVSPEMALMMNPKVVKVFGLSPEDVPSGTKNINNGVLLEKCRPEFRHRSDLDKFKFVSGWKDQAGLNIIVDGFRYDFGTGGIHGSIDSTIVHTDEDYIIFDWDVGGFYPEEGRVNNLFPEHLSSVFCDVDAELKQERAKHKKGTALNNAIKLARNGAYGDSNNKHSPFFDPKYTMSITINGQLLLCLLSEKLLEIPGLTMIQANTDGVTVRCPRRYVDHMKTICKWWEGFTHLELESAIYSRMFIRDVNSYIGEFEGGKLKSKGAYVYKSKLSQGPLWTPSDMDWHQNHSMRVVAMAAEAALVRGEDIGDFIRAHDSPFDFMLHTKVGRADQLVICDDAGNERRLQNITRYYIGVEGGNMVKISPPAKGKGVGTWKRATKVPDHVYSDVIAELHELVKDPFDEVHSDGTELDTDGLPWDERINTKNRSKYTIRRTSYQAGRLVAPCNNVVDFDRSNLDFEFYIAEALKLVEPLRGN